MKKIFLLLLCTQLTLLAMEQPSAATRKKRPAAAGPEVEQLEVLKEAEENAPAKQPRAAKKVYTLKVPTPGTSHTIDEPIDITQVQDIIASDSLAELMKEANKENTDFMLARVPTSTGGKRYVEYYEATNLHKSLFGNLNAPNANEVRRYTLKTPNRAPIAGEIYYYIYFPPTDSFNYLGTDYDLFSEGKNPILTYTFAPLIQPQNKLEFWLRLAEQYEKQNMKQQAAYYRKKATPSSPGKVFFDQAVEFLNKKDLKNAVDAFQKAYINGYDLGALAIIDITLTYILKNPQNVRPDIQKLFTEYFNRLKKALQRKPVEFLLDYYADNIPEQQKIDFILKILTQLLILNISPEDKAFIQQKITELQKLKQ